MSDDYPALAFCKRELETYRRLLPDFEAGSRKIGEPSDGRSWTDTTPEQIALLEEKIKELRTILETKPE